MTGYRQEDIDRGRAVRMKIPLDDMVKDIRAAVRALEAGRHKVGVGYCLGGSLAWLSATRIDGLTGTVGYYGGAIAEHARKAALPRIAPLGRDRPVDSARSLEDGVHRASGRAEQRLG
jgi:carboxymethylenebutenolidase